MPRCMAKTLEHKMCSRVAKPNSNYCYQHVDYSPKNLAYMVVNNRDKETKPKVDLTVSIPVSDDEEEETSTDNETDSIKLVESESDENSEEEEEEEKEEKKQIGIKTKSTAFLTAKKFFLNMTTQKTKKPSTPFYKRGSKSDDDKVEYKTPEYKSPRPKSARSRSEPPVPSDIIIPDPETGASPKNHGKTPHNTPVSLHPISMPGQIHGKIDILSGSDRKEEAESLVEVPVKNKENESVETKKEEEPKTANSHTNDLIQLYKDKKEENRAKKFVPEYVQKNLTPWKLKNVVHESKTSIIIKLKSNITDEHYILKVMLEPMNPLTIMTKTIDPFDNLIIYKGSYYLRIKEYSGPSLFFSYPYEASDVKACCTEYFQLLAKQIYHNQLTGQHCLKDGAEWRLIDFHQMTKVPKNKSSVTEKELIERDYNHMQQASETLVHSLLYDKDVLWELDLDPITKAKAFLGVMVGVHDFFYENFGHDNHMDYVENIFNAKLMQQLVDCKFYQEMCENVKEFKEFITSLETLLEVRHVVLV